MNKENVTNQWGKQKYKIEINLCVHVENHVQ